MSEQLSSDKVTPLLDVFCCQGGASRGYELAGFTPFGVDIDPQPRYPYPFHQGDAIEVLARKALDDDIDLLLEAYGKAPA